MSTYPENLNQIKQNLETEVKQRFPSISASPVAEWRLWTEVMAIAIRALQYIASGFIEIINQKLSFTRPGTIGWYAEISKLFQMGDSIRIDENGILGYPNISPEKQIIAAVAITEHEGLVTLKVAREVNGQLTGLDQAQALAFNNYITAVKFIGTRTTIVSTNADIVAISLAVYYSPMYDVAALQASVIAAMETYKQQLGFDGVIYRERLIQAILAVDGVITCHLTSITATPAGGQQVAVDVMYETQAGYFNFDYNISQLSFIPHQ